MISIITINFNNVSGLQATIESVLQQIDFVHEYIIIDGGSTDGSKNLLEQISHPKVHWISESDKGIYEAMNKGWRKATGTYCLFLNSGDFLYQQDVLQKVSHYLQGGADIIYGNLYAFDEKQSWISEFLEPPSLYYFSYYFLPHPSTFFKKSLLESLDGYKEHYKIISDWLFYVEACIRGASFQHIPLTISSFYMQGLSSGSNLGNQEKERVLAYELRFLKNDFEHFKRLRQFDTSSVTRLAKKLSDLKIHYFK